MPISATLAAHQAMNQKRQSGEYVLPLGFGEAGLPVHPSLTKQLSEYSDRNSYGPVAGVPRLREAAAGYWSRRGLPTSTDDVVAGPGSKSLLYALLMAVEGDVLLPQPSWVSYAAQVEMVGCKPLFIPTKAGQGGVPDPALIDDYLDNARDAGFDVKAVVVTQPDNPTGTMADPDTLKALCDKALAHDLVIISDEIYRDVVFDPQHEYVSAADLAGDRTIITTGLSKSLALGGWRLGVARFPTNSRGEALKERALEIASEVWSAPTQPVQYAAAYAFDEPEPITARIAASWNLHACISQRIYQQFVAAGAEVSVPQGAFYLYPDLAPFREHLDNEWGVHSGIDLSEMLLDKFAVGVLPGSALGDGKKELRFRVATSQLYGDTEQQRLEALHSDDPLNLPWIARACDRLDEVLNRLTP
ncbi:MAG TPA: pyridoxal phosphate-dependent aminotransferase [Candidatus Stackebrandtia faecavium]|nr:pyridoxal phosphate-dependent aminotransferase [Candidatus Stackebrandtia faecavium]